MADVDILPSRGIRAAALVNGNGIAVTGTQTVAQLAARGMRSICEVTPLGVAANGAASTMAQLASMGIRAFCPVSELGVATDSSTAATLRQRGIPPMVPVSATGIALSGSATILTLAQRGLPCFCPLDETGNATTLVDPTPLILHALTGTYQLTGEDMTPITELVMQADNSGVTNKFVLAGQSADLVAPIPAEDAATTAWVNAVLASGLPGSSAVSPTQRSQVDALIVAYKAAGVWTILDHEWLFASESRATASIDIKGLIQHTSPLVPMVFTAGRGFKEGGFGGYLDLGFAPSTAVNFQQNAASIGGYVLTNRTTAAPATVIGTSNSATGSYVFFRPINPGIEHVINDSNFNSPANSTAMGNYIISRNSATSIVPYKNNAALATQTTAAAVARPPYNFYAFGMNPDGGTPVVSQDEIASVFTGGSFTGTQALAKNAALNAYMTSVGCNVY